MDQWFVRIDHKVGQVCNLSSDNGLARKQMQYAAEHMGAEVVSGLLELPIPAEVLKLVPAEFARKHRCLPLGWQGDELKMVFSDPLNINAMDELVHHVGRTLFLAVADPDELARAIKHYYPGPEDQSLVTSAATFRELAIAEIDRVASLLPFFSRIDFPTRPWSICWSMGRSFV